MRSNVRILVLALVLAACTSSADTTTTSSGAVTTTGAHHETTTSSSGTTVPPRSRTAVTITEDQTFPDGFTIPADEAWVLDPNTDITLTSMANVVVLGELVMSPASGDVEHALLFEGVDVSAFVGGGMDPVPTDVGLWVMGDGQLTLEGEEKTSWGYEYDPAWAGDEVIAAPNTPGDYEGFLEVTSTPPPNDLGYPTELLNLTRNVRIEGTPDGYSHVFLRSTQPQTIRYVALRYMAPGFGEIDQTGRYGLHFHMSGDGSRGTLVEGVVIRDTDNHAFVPHAAHGITFRDTIAFNVHNEAYWWDPAPEEEDMVNDTNDLLWERAVAASVGLGFAGNEFRLAGFYLGNGENVTVRDSVAVGIVGDSGFDRSGFIWPEGAGAVWTFEDNVAHNNEVNGVFVWQNNSERHDVDRFLAYYNGGAGIRHGAYENAYRYRELTLLDNGASIVSLALGKSSEGVDTQVWSDIRTDGGDLVIGEHQTPTEVPVRFEGCDFANVFVEDSDGAEPSTYDFIDCDLEPESFDLTESLEASRFRVQRSDGTAFLLEGNGALTEIDAFFDN